MKISIGAVVLGGTSLGYKTGNWRDMRPYVKNELCKDCGICEMVCPDGAIAVIEREYIIDYDYCKGCGLCARECASAAIVMEPEVK